MEITEIQHSAATEIQRCYLTLQNANSNVVWEILKSAETIYEWDHYPPQDVQDKNQFCQYYYHSHPSSDSVRVPEHGHFHLFLHKKAFLTDAVPLTSSQKYQNSQGREDALSHFIAIAMNEKGFPTALFTTNHWVAWGLWYKASDLCRALDHFIIEEPQSPYYYTSLWLTNMVRLFKPQIEELLYKRDEIIDEYFLQNQPADVWNDRNLEITSILRFSDV